jgi:hypothetical protein
MVSKVTEIVNDHKEWLRQNSGNILQASIEAFRRLEQNNPQFATQFHLETKNALENGDCAQPYLDMYYDTVKLIINEDRVFLWDNVGSNKTKRAV